MLLWRRPKKVFQVVSAVVSAPLDFLKAEALRVVSHSPARGRPACSDTRGITCDARYREFRTLEMLFVVTLFVVLFVVTLTPSSLSPIGRR